MLKMSEITMKDRIIPKHDHPPLLKAGVKYMVWKIDYKKREYKITITTEKWGYGFEINKRNFNKFNKA